VARTKKEPNQSPSLPQNQNRTQSQTRSQMQSSRLSRGRQPYAPPRHGCREHHETPHHARYYHAQSRRTISTPLSGRSRYASFQPRCERRRRSANGHRQQQHEQWPNLVPNLLPMGHYSCLDLMGHYPSLVLLSLNPSFPRNCAPMKSLRPFLHGHRT